MSGPPKNKEDDEKIVRDFMADDAKRIICGETTSKMVARVLNKPLVANKENTIYQIEGINLATEGIMTMNEAISIVQEYVENDDLSEEFFDKLEGESSGATLARLLIENCTDVIIYVGTAPTDSDDVLEMENRKELIKQLSIFIEALGRHIHVKYY
jgi:hypothetical protein